jgi:L-amino acid N-acyltransferase YncA
MASGAPAAIASGTSSGSTTDAAKRTVAVSAGPAATVRYARPADAAAIAAIYNQGIEERQATFETAPREPADVEPWITARESPPVLVAENGVAVRGWARITAYDERAAYAGVGEYGIYVDRAARGRGLGRQLLEALAAEASAHGYWKLIGLLFTDNQPSRALARACGFSDVGVHRRHGRLDGEWRDVLVVERPLGDAASK